MKHNWERGNASIGAIVGTALAGLLYLQNVQRDVTSQINESRNTKLRTESNEAALYALSVASQLLKNDPATNVPRIAAVNFLNAPLNQKLEFQSMTTMPAGPVSLDHGSIVVNAPVGGQITSTDFDQLFRTQEFHLLHGQQKSERWRNGGTAGRDSLRAVPHGLRHPADCSRRHRAVEGWQFRQG